MVNADQKNDLERKIVTNIIYTCNRKKYSNIQPSEVGYIKKKSCSQTLQCFFFGEFHLKYQVKTEKTYIQNIQAAQWGFEYQRSPVFQWLKLAC